MAIGHCCRGAWLPLLLLWQVSTSAHTLPAAQCHAAVQRPIQLWGGDSSQPSALKPPTRHAPNRPASSCAALRFAALCSFLGRGRGFRSSGPGRAEPGHQPGGPASAAAEEGRRRREGGGGPIPGQPAPPPHEGGSGGSAAEAEGWQVGRALQGHIAVLGCAALCCVERARMCARVWRGEVQLGRGGFRDFWHPKP